MIESAPSPSLTPRTLRHAAVYRRPAAGSGSYVVVEDGDDLAVIEVPVGSTHMGRSFTAEIQLDHPTVSRRHAMLIRDDAGTRILDDGSENGVHVNGVRTTGCMLRDGDRIELGRVRLRFVLRA